jgi:hypothetical protein
MYPHRPDLYKKWFYVCSTHDTRVGCHPDSKDPLSLSMAGAELRQLRSQVHKLFDPLWRNGHFKKRGKAYLWLATEMGIATKDCHVSYFNENQCHKAIAVLDSYCSELQAEALKEQQEAKWKAPTSLFKENQ